MALISLTDAFCYAAGGDWTGQSNNLTLGVDVAQLDKTTFASGGWQESAGGLKTTSFNLAGFWDVTFDNVAQLELGQGLLITQPYTVGPSEVEGDPAYMFQARRGQYTAGGQVGELKPFTLQSYGADGRGVVRGQLAKAKGSVSATGALGSGVNLGAVSSTQFLYAAFHLFAPVGTTITVQVQSDDNSGFTTPTTVATIGPLTVGGGTWMTPVAGAITDTWYRFNVSAITGTFSVAGALGIA